MAPKAKKTSTKKTETDHLDEARAAILASAVANAGFDGWSSKVLRAAVEEAGVDKGLARLAFPRGASDLVDYFWRDGDRQLIEQAGELDVDAMKIRTRIATLVKLRLSVMAEHREAARRAAAAQVSPFQGLSALQNIYHTVDAIWSLAGDTSTDYNFYSKRLILSGVYISSFVYWQGDHSDGFVDTESFVDRRIEDVMQIEKVKAAGRKISEKLPTPFKLLAQLRYGLRNSN